MKTALVISILLLFQACGANRNKSKPSDQHSGGSAPTQPVARIDPNSAPLYPAHKKTLAPDFKVTLVNGEPFRLSDLEGKIVLINIWATWCPPCREETPELVSLYTEYKDKGLTVLGVSVDEQGKSVVLPFIRKFHVTYPIYIDKDKTVLNKYGPIMGIPTSYIIGKRGYIRYYALGPLTKKELEPRIQQLLKDKF